MTATVQRVVIVGGGSVAWLAAAGLRRAFHKRGVAVTVVDTGADTGAPLARWTLPSQRGMHALLGIQEPELLRRTGATFKLAIEHMGWQAGESRFAHAHGEIGTELSGTPFYKFLLLQALDGEFESPELYSVAAVAARMGRFARPMGGDKELTSSFTYGFHLDESAYASYLREHALKLGVDAVNGAVAAVVLLEGGNIAALRLANDMTVSGELFIDCSGASAQLMRQLSNDDSTPGREDWSAWLPADRLMSARAPAMPDPPAMTRTYATDIGWMWHVPQARASIVGHVYSSRFSTDDHAFAELRAAAPGLQAAPQIASLAAGRRRRIWERNCVALGAAAMQIEPLVGADLHFAQLGLGTLIELFPLDASSAVEGVEYNRVMTEHADALRDFTIAHYRVGAARSGDFWAAARALAAPDRLGHKLDLYAASGRINLLDFETFEEVDWAWLLMGARSIPRALEVQIRTRLESINPQQIAPLRMHVERLAASMPRHDEYVLRASGQNPNAAKH